MGDCMKEQIWGPVQIETNQEVTEDLECDVLVIGGGIAGYLTAFHLQENFKVILVEKDTLFSKTTGKTTAFITPYQGPIYAKMAHTYNKQIARTFHDSQRYAIARYKELMIKYQIQCEASEARSFLYTLKEDRTWKDELKVLKDIRIPYHETSDVDEIIKQRAKKVIEYDQPAFQFNPILFLNQLPKKFTIYEHTKVNKIHYKENVVDIENGHHIHATYIIVATNFPIIDYPWFAFSKLYRYVSYAGMAEGVKPLLGQYVGTKDEDLYLRNHEDKVIFGGFDHKSGDSGTENRYQKLLASTYPNQPTITYNTMDSMTHDHLPFIGQIGKKQLYVITGFNEYGMANAMLAAQVIKDTLYHQTNPYSHLVSTFRPYIRYNLLPFTINMLRNSYYIFKQLIGFPLKADASLSKGEAGVVWYQGKKRAVYKDEEGDIHHFKTRCTHFNCQIKYNSTAKVFECPCHGSRYDVDGHVLYGPASFDHDSKVN